MDEGQALPAPLAYFLTWTTYGTWLHGDERGSVDAQHNELHTPSLPPSTQREHIDGRRLKHPVLTLDSASRALVDSIIRRHCDIRGWRLHAVNVRTNHVHVVVNCDAAVTPADAMDQFKAWGTRRLREGGHVPIDHPVWTEGGSKQWINVQDGLTNVIDYVLNQQ